MARKYVEEEDIFEEEDLKDDGSDDEYDDDAEDDAEEEDDDGAEEEDDNEDEEEEEPVRKKKAKREVDDEDSPRYSSKHLTKIISAKHNKMKNQFSKKFEEAMAQTAGDLESANAIVNWLCQQSNMNRDQVLAKIGFQPTGKKPVIDAKMFDVSAGDEMSDDIQAQINKIQSRVSNYPGFKENKKMIVEYAQDTGLPVEKAYWALMGEKAAQSARKAGADEVLARKKSKAARVTEGSTTTGKVRTYTKSDKEAARAAGMSVEDYVKYQNVEDYDSYMATKNKKSRR